MTLEEILEIAIMAEIDAAKNYKKMAQKTNIFFLKDKLNFLENEEIGHRHLLEKLFKTKFPTKKITLPAKSTIPFKKFEITGTMHISEMIDAAMESEKIASSFYKDMETKLENKEEKAMARYLSNMEESHYYLLKSELELAYNFELYDEVHAMMHVGP